MTLDRYIDWIRHTALPAWAARGFDAGAGRFHERLDGGGRPIAVPHRAMAQARQIFVFAHAAEEGWSTDGVRLAETAMARLIADFAAHDGDETSFAFSIDPVTCAVVSPLRDAYAHAFILFAIAALVRLNGDQKLLDLADSTIRFIERGLTDPVHGGLFDALPPPPRKRQNPHMHLLEAYLFLEQAAPGRGYLERAGAIVRLFEARFLQNQYLIEYFDQDWTPADPPLWEPGHHFEWVWLLDEYRRLSGEDVAPLGEALYHIAVDRGMAPGALIIDELSATDGAVIKPSHRIWPHTEAIKAAAVRHHAGDAKARPFAETMATALLDTFLDRPFAGGWIDHVAPDRTPLVEHVPATTLYHLVLAASVAARGFPTAPPLAKAQA